MCTYNQGVREGEGCEYFANGDSYIGQYSNGLKHGFGCYSKLIYVDTQTKSSKYSAEKESTDLYSYLVYQGNFKDDQRH